MSDTLTDPATLPSVEHYAHANATNEDLEWADLPIVDFSQYDSPVGFSELAAQASEAMRTNGFLYVINHGYTKKEADRIFDLGNLCFTHVSDDEKKAYEAGLKQNGSYEGYKLRKYWHITNGVRDEVELYNLDRLVYTREHPKALRPFLPEIEAFGKHNHFNVLHKLLRLLEVGMELPQDYFVNMHGYDAPGETYVRFMKYYPRPADDEEKSNGVWLKGHTDFGSLTILWSQPVSGLQILSPEGKWKWVEHIENALVINIGDALEFLSGGYYKATIHRVVLPPIDQRGVTRLGAFYFARTDDSVRLAPCVDASPVLRRIGMTERFKEKGWEGKEAPTMEEWRRSRTTTYGQADLKKGKEEGVEEEVLNGVVVKHYN